METVHKLLREVKVLPPAPEVLPKVLEALRHEQTSLDEIGELVALDPALTAKLLHYCNGVYFAGANPVASVPEAIGRVGFQTIFTLVSVMTGAKCFNPPDASGISGAQLWKHSLTTAFLCKFIAEDLGVDNNLLFTAGLLHDIGRVVLAHAKGAEYGRLYNGALRYRMDCTIQEQKAYGFSHGEVGAALMETWRFPFLLIQAVRFHHRPAAAGVARNMAAAACVGNALAHHFEQPADSLDANEELQAALQVLALEARNLELYHAQMQEHWEVVNQLLTVVTVG
jgi:putative nucleotidyltransferase with HDIG domain